MSNTYNQIFKDEKLEIRKFTTEYQDQVIKLVLKVQKEFNIPITLAEQSDLKDIAKFYQNGVGNFWIALLNGKVVGTIAILDIGNKQVALRKMFVEKTLRGKEFGIGLTLLQQVFAYCETKDIAEIYLGTTVFFLAAHRFYEKNGFKEISINDLPSSFSIMPVDTKFYVYIL
jgi:N-acetylglutamate synthase-like GNAT family acetyltransferase